VLVKEVSHMGYGGNAVGGIQTVVSARNASLPLPVLLKSSLPCLHIELFEELPHPCCSNLRAPFDF